MINQNPPHTNGIMELSNTDQDRLRNQLVNIRDSFVPTDDQPVCDTFYLVVEHTRKHGDQTTFTQLNGDTVDFLLGSVENDG